ncbi:MAG: 4-hydroxybenzoate octaprenyltransferase [Pseudomonadota bacterium]
MSSNAPSAGPADADRSNWVDRYAPDAARPYLRLIRADRPVGVWLLLIPCLWGTALAAAQGAGGWFSLQHAALFAIGAYVMRGAGCAYNDIVDRDFDAQVARTAQRPLPAGDLSIAQAWTTLIALCLIGLAVLLQFNRFTIVIGLASLMLVAAYPFMKRITWWPQAWLGLTFNWGALVGYAAATGALDAAAVAVYAAGVFWTLGYDTIYAHQDKEDDALIGVKSSARRLGDGTKPALGAFFAATIGLFAFSGWRAGFSAAYYLALAAPAAHFAWQYRAIEISNGANCLNLFKKNRDAGLLLLAPLLLETLLRAA